MSAFARREIPTRRRTALARSGFPAMAALVVVLSIGILGVLYVRSERRNLRDQVEAQLAAIADLKMSQIAAWRSERLADAEAYSRILAPKVKELLARPAALHAELGPELRTIAVSYGYSDVAVIDPHGSTLASAGEAEPPPQGEASRQLAAAIRDGAVIADVERDGRVELHVVAAIFDPMRPGAALAGFLVRVDPRTALFPMLQRWPAPSATAEVALLKISGGSVVSLNEARYRTDRSTTLSLSLEDTRFPAVRIARGDEGLIRSTDYRGMDVVAVGRAVPRSPWFVGVKVDASEIFAPARSWSIALGAVVLLLVASGVGALTLWWRHQAALRERARYGESRRYQAFTRHLELLSEHADDVVLLVDFDGRIVRANERVREQYGWSVEELVGQDLRVLRAPGFDETREQLELVREQGRGRYETMHRRRDGTTFPVDVSARRFDAHGHAYFQAIVRDATERRRVLAELSYQAEILQNVYDGVIGLDAEHVVRSWNAGAERMYGIPASEAIGKPIRDLLPSEYQGYGSWREFVDDVNGGDRMQFQVRRKVRDGRELEIEGAAVVLRDSSRRISGYVTINRDVTEQRRAREQLLHAQKMEAVGQLASGVAHDFNNLLVAILSCSEFLLDSIEPSDPRRTDVQEIREAGQRAAHLVRQLLAFARKNPARPATVELQTVVRGMEQLLRRTLGEHVELSSCLEPCLARIDPGQLEQVLMNLAVNGRDAMPGGGRLHIETRTAVVERLPIGTDGLAPGRYALLTVADTGCGITPEVLPRIFEPFFTTKGAGRGTGLGLSTAYAIVREAGGRISVDSQPGRGTRFSVYLPAGEAAEVGETLAATAPARTGQGRTVLVVEDEEVVRRVAKRTLQGGGYAVVEAATADEALAHLDRGVAVDVVLSDVVMPGRSGVELASALEARQPDLPVVLMSGYSEWQQGAGSRRVLDKPFTAEALLARVEEELRGTRTARRAPATS